MTWHDAFELAAQFGAWAMVDVAGIGIYVLIQRWRGKPAPRWLGVLNPLIKPDRKRLDRLVSVLGALAT